MTAKKLYYSMGEVAEMFDVTPALIRHWEAQFDCIKPHRNKKGNRLFSPEDVERLKQIYHLVKERGMTLKGANKVLKRAKSDEMVQEIELLERLQKIRSALVEVREELKADAGEKLLDDYPQEQEVAEVVVKKPKRENVEAAQSSDVEAVVGEKKAVAVEDNETASEQPKKRVVRRRKKSDEEDKELFPFYEQSLF